ncbi:MAG: ATP-binding protein [bacterium]|nr:ATP-binding protein [bacterium]
MIKKAALNSFKPWRFWIVALAVLSLISFGITAWLLADFRHEQAIIKKITEHLPASDIPQARQLAQELQLQSRLSLLLVVNLFGSAFALALLARAYQAGERQLRRIRIQAEDILASLDQGVITADQDGVLINVNPKAQDLLGGGPIGTPFAPHRSLGDLPESHHKLDEMRAALVQGTPVDEQLYCVEQQHQLRYLRAGCSVLRDHDERPAGVVIHLQDVTEKNLMQQRLLRMERYMGLGSLAAGLQHEIKNPLSALALHVQLLQESRAKNRFDESVDESLDVLATEVRRITRVLESFRDFASIRDLDLTPTDLRQLLRRLVKLTGVEASEKGIQLSVHASDTEEFIAEVDATRMEQVILNLILNAFAAMPCGGEMSLDLARDEGSITLSVSDSGSGIPDAFQDKVFDLYFTTKATGTGMGLAICDKIIRQHEGTIDFVTSPNGTTFTIHLPVTTRDDAKAKDSE